MHVISQIPTTATLKTLAEHESLVVLAVRELLFQTLSLEDMSAMAPALAVEETSLYMATFLHIFIDSRPITATAHQLECSLYSLVPVMHLL